VKDSPNKKKEESLALKVPGFEDARNGSSLNVHEGDASPSYVNKFANNFKW